MDECDGMSAGDRGGMAELIQLIKKTKMPIICACQRSFSRKSDPCKLLFWFEFRRPEARQLSHYNWNLSSRRLVSWNEYNWRTCCLYTGDIEPNPTNLLSNITRLTHQSLSFDESKTIGQTSKRTLKGTLWCTSFTFIGSKDSRDELKSKIDLYFIDNGLMPLMGTRKIIYLKSRANNREPFIWIRELAHRSIIQDLWHLHGQRIRFRKRPKWTAWFVDTIKNGPWLPFAQFISVSRPAYFCSGEFGSRVDFASSWVKIPNKNI